MKNFKCLHLLIPVLLIASAYSCNSGENKQINEENRVSISNPPTPDSSDMLKAGMVSDLISPSGNSYSVYIPSVLKSNQVPVIIFFDPHGRGRFPLNRYKELAERFGFILYGSNAVKNGMAFERIETIAGELVGLANQRSLVNHELPDSRNKLFLAGFSGGARVSLMAGNSLQDTSGIQGIIYCGAALPANAIALKRDMLGFAGREDMNYTEVLNFHASTAEAKINSSLSEWNGKHEWPDTTTFKDAFYWSLFALMRKDLIPKDESVPEKFTAEQSRAIKSEKNILNKAANLEKCADMLAGFSQQKKFKTDLAGLLKTSGYRNQKKSEEKMLLFENNKKQEFMEAFKYKDASWWKNEISKLSANPVSPVNKRLLGYISLAAWTFSNKAIAENNFPFAQRTLLIYKMADPSNAEQPFLQACLLARGGMQDSAMHYLTLAVTMGFDDIEKLETDQSLSLLRSRNDYGQLIGSIKK